MWPVLNSVVTLTVIPFICRIFPHLIAAPLVMWSHCTLSCDIEDGWRPPNEAYDGNGGCCTVNKLAAHGSTGSKKSRATSTVPYLFQLKNPFLRLRIRNDLKHALVITFHNAVGGLGVLTRVSIICFYLAAHFPNGQIFRDNKLI